MTSCCMNFAIKIQWINFTIWKKEKELSPLRCHIKFLQYHIKTSQEFAKKSNIPWIWSIIYGHKLSYMKKTRKKKQVCSAACFMAAEIKFSKDVCLSVTHFWICSHHHIIMKISGVISNYRSDTHAKSRGQRSKVNVTEVKKVVDFDPDWAFPDYNSSLNSPMATKLTTKLDVA